MTNHFHDNIENFDKTYAFWYDQHMPSNSQQKMTIRSCTSSQARETLYRLMDDVAVSHQPIMITGKRNNVIMMSEEDYRSLEETLYLLSIPGMRESLLEAGKEPIEKGIKADQVEWE